MLVSVGASIDSDKFFGKYKGRKIALYGLGTETKRVLHSLEDQYEIVGLLDSFRADGELYGKRIISLDDAVDAGICLVIVVARPSSCRAITKAIGSRCRQRGIALMDIRGRNLLETKRISYCFSDIRGATRAKLAEKIKDADVISFDLFDTLVMRQTVSSDDVAEFVDCRLREKGIYINDFCKKRLGIEKELSKNAAPTLVEIYQNLLGKSDGGAAGIAAEELADLEWNTDFELLVPRIEMCDIFRGIVNEGKSAYIVSDTYYNKSRLAKILEKCDIIKYTDILSSSDCKVSKTQGLYKVLQEREKSKKCLHIGDDIVADIEKARDQGFDTYRVFSGADLLEDVGNLGLSECVGELSDRLKTGMFVSRIFNSPFQFESEDRHIEISDVYDIGYLLCAPLISDFVLWFRKCMEEGQFKNIWFGARDGYLIKKMYDYLMESYDQYEKTVYFLTSRTAAIRAGVRDERDIRYVDEMKFSGALEGNLRERFGIDASAVDGEDILAEETGLMRYKKAILTNAERENEHYQKYISKLEIHEGDIAFFDFVAKGTVQMYIQRLIGSRIKGFYFLQLEQEHMKGRQLDIQSFYEDEETDACAVYENYYILEPLLTAAHPSVQGFNQEGDSVYTSETREKRDILCAERAQEGIFDYFKIYLRLCSKAERKINKKLDEIFLNLIHTFKITDMDFLNLVVEDSFFNRMTKMTDIL